MNKPRFALIDCNNFFVSCERVFRPDLEGKPVVVLSSNDGCAVARSNEVKQLGIPMGAPAYKYRETFRQHGVIQFSANFDLYGDISQRITRLLTHITPRIEVYSVDESFLDLSELTITDYIQWGREMRQRIWHEIGIPVSIGIAPTKTLAKLATERAKHDPELDGVLNLIHMPSKVLSGHLACVPIRDVWGVGWRLTPKLKAEGVSTALQLQQLLPKRAQQLMGIHGRQLVAELNSISCYPLEPAHKVRQSIMHGRLFSEDTHDKAVVEAAIASLTARATMRLRRERLLACTAVVRLATNRHKPGYRQLLHSVRFSTPTADPGVISTEFIKGIDGLFNPHLDYHRADIMLYDLVSLDYLQTDLFGTVDIPGADISNARLSAVDYINDRYGKGTLHYAAEDLSQRWVPKHNSRSPRYTTNWEELPFARLP